MSLGHGPRMTRNGLVFCFDPKNTRCYSGEGVSCSDLIIRNAGIIENAPTHNPEGYFDFSTNKYIRFPNDTSLDNQSFSIEVFIKTGALTQNGFWFEKGTVNSQYALFQEGGAIRFRYNGSGIANAISLTTSLFLNTTDWFHIVATNTQGSQALYINSVLRGTNNLSTTVAVNNGGMSVGAYGGYSGSRGYYYSGSIGMVRVYNRAITSIEVAQNFEAMRGRYGI